LLSQRKIVSWRISIVNARRGNDRSRGLLFLPVAGGDGVDASSILEVRVSSPGSTLLDLSSIFGGRVSCVDLLALGTVENLLLLLIVRSTSG